jgi:hypothetical protein
MIRRALAAGAACILLAAPALSARPVQRSADEHHKRCVTKPFPGPRWCAAEWNARPSSSPSSSWFIPEPWLRAKLARIRSCESGGRYTIATGNGFFGAYQFMASTWASQGGFGLPHQASPGEQDFRAARLFRAAGPRPWPHCGFR